MMAAVLRFFMRVCMEPRLLPGVRWSTLKMVKSWPSCWMTMPGRSCVALTLLIVFCGPDHAGADSSLESLPISEIQAGQERGRIRNDSRHAGRKNASNAKQQYKCARLPRSIILNSRSAFRNSEREPGAIDLVLSDRAVFPVRVSREASHL